MDDKKIIDLYFGRDERAIRETEEKYRPMIAGIAKNFLSDTRDVDECVNDTLMDAWNSMPPTKPDHLNVYLARLAKNRAINTLKESKRIKRGGGIASVSFDELEDIIEDKEGPEDIVLAKELSDIISAFLKKQPQVDMQIFIRHYWFADRPSDIAAMLGMRTMNVNLRLHRLRKKLKEHLIRKGYGE